MCTYMSVRCRHCSMPCRSSLWIPKSYVRSDKIGVAESGLMEQLCVNSGIKRRPTMMRMVQHCHCRRCKLVSKCFFSMASVGDVRITQLDRKRVPVRCGAGSRFAGLVLPDGVVVAGSVGDAGRRKHHGRVVDDRRDPRKCHRRVDHPVAEPLLTPRRSSLLTALATIDHRAVAGRPMSYTTQRATVDRSDL